MAQDQPKTELKRLNLHLFKNNNMAQNSFFEHN